MQGKKPWREELSWSALGWGCGLQVERPSRAEDLEQDNWMCRCKDRRAAWLWHSEQR